MSFRAFAAKIKAAGYDVSGETVRKYELGANGGFTSVPVDYARTVCQVFNLRLDWLVSGEQPKHPIPLDVEVQGFREIAAVVNRTRATAPPANADDALEAVDDSEETQGPEEETGTG